MKNRIASSIVVLCLPDRGGGGRGANRISPHPPRRTVGRVFRRQECRTPIDGWRRTSASRAEVADWVAAENKVTRRYLDSIPQREKIRRRHHRAVELHPVRRAAKGRRPLLLPEERRPAKPAGPLRDGFARRAGPASCWTPTPGPRTARLPWAGWPPATTAATWPTAGPRPAPTGSAGRSWRSTPASCCADELRWTKSPHASWSQDGQGFFYSRYEKPKAGAEFQALNFNNRLCYHRLGTPQARRRGGLLSARASRSGNTRGRPPRTAATWSSPPRWAPTIATASP